MKRKTPKIELSIEERKQLLAKPTWTFKDVMQYTGFAKSKSFEIMQICREKLNGKVLFNEHAITRNSLLAYLNTSIEQERYVIKQLEEKE
jgi:hypothetical protein